MNKIFDFIMRRRIVLGVVLFFSMIIFALSRGFLLLGGEGNYFLDISLVKDIHRYAWHPLVRGIGFSNPILNFSFGFFDFFSALQKLGFSFKFINLLSVVLVYLLPFISIYWLLKNILKLDLRVAIPISLFYILNPFATVHLQSMMFWNVAPLFVFPLVFGIIHKYYFDKFKLFFVFGIVIAMLSFSLANIPYLGVFHIFLLISIIIISYLHKNKFDYIAALKNLFILEVSFIVFNAWWLINLVRFQLQDLGMATFNEFVLNWIAQYSTNDQGIINSTLALKMLITNIPDYFFSTFYFNNFVSLILYIPIIILLVALIFRTNRRSKILMILPLFLVLVVFINKGANEPFGFIYVWMLKNIPFFIIFKTPLEKFSVLLVFIFALTLAFALKDYKKKPVYYALGLYLLVCSVPYLTLNFMPDYKLGDNQYMSRIFTDKQEYREARNIINNEKLDYRTLSLPGSLNYQVTMANHDDKYYRGMDPILYGTNKSFIAAYSSAEIKNIVFGGFSNPGLNNLLSIYGIKKVMLNKDIIPSFGFAEKESFDELDELFSKNMNKWSSGQISLYDSDVFLPHFYTPKSNIVSLGNIKNIADIASRDSDQIRSAVFFREQNEGKDDTLNYLNGKVDGSQVLEFKKINPTKYRVMIHGASGRFPLVFSESFHNGWKAYLVQSSKLKVESSDTKYQLLNTKYKVLDGNEEDQAAEAELAEYIEKGWVTNLGNGQEKEIKHKKWVNNSEKLDYVEKYNIDFISKNFQGTIQNDNLPDGHIWENWFKKPLAEENHLLVNGYANSWVIDADKICSENPNMCVKNEDGTYDLEMVVDFWPQRLFYVGLGISGLTLLACLGYLGWDFARRRKKSNICLEQR